MNIRTMGDLMDYANETNDGDMKDYLRIKFKEFCNKTMRNPWYADTVKLWRNEPVTAFDIQYWVLREKLEIE